MQQDPPLLKYSEMYLTKKPHVYLEFRNGCNKYIQKFIIMTVCNSVTTLQ
jgi:hypothetical protein